MKKTLGEAVGRGQTAPVRHPKPISIYSLGGLTAVNVGKHSNLSVFISFLNELPKEEPPPLQRVAHIQPLSAFADTLLTITVNT